MLDIRPKKISLKSGNAVFFHSWYCKWVKPDRSSLSAVQLGKARPSLVFALLAFATHIQTKKHKETRSAIFWRKFQTFFAAQYFQAFAWIMKSSWGCCFHHVGKLQNVCSWNRHKQKNRNVYFLLLISMRKRSVHWRTFETSGRSLMLL